MYRPAQILLVALDEPDLQDAILVRGLRGTRIDQMPEVELFQITPFRRVHTDLQRPVRRLQPYLVPLHARQFSYDHDLAPLVHYIHQRLTLLLHQGPTSTGRDISELSNDRLPISTERHGEAVDERRDTLLRLRHLHRFPHHIIHQTVHPLHLLEHVKPPAGSAVTTARLFLRSQNSNHPQRRIFQPYMS